MGTFFIAQGSLMDNAVRLPWLWGAPPADAGGRRLLGSDAGGDLSRGGGGGDDPSGGGGGGNGLVIHIPSATMALFNTGAIILLVPLYDKVVDPMLTKLGRKLTLLQKIGWGMVIAALAMFYAAGIETWRLALFRSEHNGGGGVAVGERVAINILWQAPAYILVGASEVLASVGQLEFFYDQAASTRAGEAWLPKDLNYGHLDRFLIFSGSLMLANTLIFLWVALSYEYKSLEHKVTVIVPSVEDAAAAAAAEQQAVGGGAPGAPAAAGLPPGLPRPRAAITIARGRRRGYPPGARRPRREGGEGDEGEGGEGVGEEGEAAEQERDPPFHASPARLNRGLPASVSPWAATTPLPAPQPRAGAARVVQTIAGSKSCRYPMMVGVVTGQMRLSRFLVAALAVSALAAGARAADVAGLKASANGMTASALAAAGGARDAATRAAGQAGNALNSTGASLHKKAADGIESAAQAANAAHAALFAKAGPAVAVWDAAAAHVAGAAKAVVAPKAAFAGQKIAAGMNLAKPVATAAQAKAAQATAAANAFVQPKLAVANGVAAQANAAVAGAAKAAADKQAAALKHVVDGAAGHVNATLSSKARVAALAAEMSHQTQEMQEQIFHQVSGGLGALLTPKVALLQNSTGRFYKTVEPTLRAVNSVSEPINKAVAPITDKLTGALTAGMNAYSDVANHVLGAAMDAAAPVVDAAVTVSENTGKALADLTLTQAAAVADLGALAARLNITVASLVAANVTDKIVQALVANAALLNVTTQDITELGRTAVASMKRGDPQWPRPKNVNDTASGTCSPFTIPAGSQSVLEFCKKMRKMPPSYFKDIFEKSAPAAGDAFPLKGCVFGCIVANDWYTDLQEKFGETFGWSGKCFSEELRADGTPLYFGSTLQRDFHAPSGKNQTERTATFKGSGEFIFGGEGKFVEKSLWDGKPTWQYYDDPVSMRMQLAGGWRTQYNMFQAVGDGVTDEFRRMGNGHVIGKSFYRGPSGFMPERFRRNAATNYFMLFQACTKDGKVPWYPEFRDVPLAGNP
ncbi:MAG: POT family-domain-containing protein [Monoraphidium minutum]|nr:MAG: POT family-domain-containing protein [Monoraphidium minutum]